MFNVKALLESHGNEVIPFSVHSDRNEPTEYDRYFVEPIGGRSAVYYEDYKKTPRNIWKMFARSVYSLEVKRALKREICDVKPDIVYVLQCINKLSPSVIRAAKQMGVPVVYRLSDYQLMCPKFDFLRGTDVCEECMHKGLVCAIRHRCVKGSLAASMVRVFAMRFQRMIRIYDDVDAYVTPSAFLRDKMIEAGFRADMIHHIPTFTRRDVAGDASGSDAAQAGSYGLYVGRIAAQKDLDTVIKAYELLPDHKLMIVGDDTSDEARILKEYISSRKMTNVEFTGFRSGKELEDTIRGSRFQIMPSIWYENLPNSALESMLYGKPLIASDIGSLRELVDDGVNGYLYEPRNHTELADRIRKMDDDARVTAMGEQCLLKMRETFSPEAHYTDLFNLFSNLVS